MKVRLTEEQLQNIIKQPINENYINSSPESIQLANQLFSDPNNRTLWRCYWSKDEQSIFANGMSSDWFDAGEGSYHGKGVYAFYEPYGAQKRCGTGGVGDKIMKGVLRNKFRNFIILDGDMAERYYGSYDIRTQVNTLYTDENFKREFLDFYKYTVGSYEVPRKRSTGYISKALFERFKMKLRTGKVRGVVYNGGQDPNACVIYNPRDFIPICVTKERRLNASGRDFDNWEVRITPEIYNKLKNIDDYYSYGEKLKASGLIKDYTKVPPTYGFLRVTLNNGKTSYYDIKNDRIISNYGFDMSFGFSKDNDGTIVAPCAVKVGGRTLEFFIIPDEGEYYVCRFNKQANEYSPIPKLETTARYDKMIPRLSEPKQMMGPINEAEGVINHKIEDFKRITNLNCYFESVYHRTRNPESCNSICKYGFSPQYSSCECYGHGIYAALTPQDSTDHLSSYGRYMIHAYLKDGFKNFVIFNERLARKYYGENWRVRDQLKLLIRPEYYKELISRHNSLEYDQNIIETLDGELGMTNIRGSVVNYGGCYITVICDWKSAIPYEYSTDNGNTWNKTLNEENFKYIDTYKDGLFAIQKFIADGIVKDTFGITGFRRNHNWNTDINAHPQFVNGYLRVILTNGKISFFSAEDNNLISYAGFDNAIGWEKDVDGEPCLNCMVMNRIFRIYKYEGQYIFTQKKGDGYDPVELKNGKILTTRIYDKISSK